MSIIDLLNRWFRREEINGANRCPTYLFRWTLIYCRWFGIYVHRFVGDDWSLDLHDHPKRFISIGLRGQYVEETPAGEQTFCSPWFRSFPAEHKHRLRLIDGKECWTLVVVLRAVRPWGFWHLGSFIPWKQYVTEIGGAADMMKSCPDEEST